MSIEDTIEGHVATGNLHWIRNGTEPIRRLYVSTVLYRALDGLSGNQIQWAEILSDLHQFAAGVYEVKVRRLGRSEDVGEKADMVRLAQRHPGDPEEIWEIRICWQEPEEPQIRIFGRFAGLDCFIALTWEYRYGLDYSAAMQTCAGVWAQLFPDDDYWKGRYYDGYLSKARFAD